ncbi:MAG: rane-bound lytic murein transglycosylase [Bacteroidota bacterium]|nr:rane-bound lytic murein transglycosylase [Bacteroidota bacterium]
MKAIFLNKIAIAAYILIAGLAFILYSSKYLLSSGAPRAHDKRGFFKPVIDKLKAKGFDSVSIYKVVDDEDTKFDEKYVKINVSGYLKPVDYSHNYSEKSIKEVRDFIRKNRKILQNCERIYGVPKEMVAAILWVETKFGKYLGGNNLPSVFISTAMASQPEYIQLNIEELHRNYAWRQQEFSELEEKIRQRAFKKAEWALTELMALIELQKQNRLVRLKISGSWAGAFGIPQFLPTSYSNWAADGNGDGIVDLYDLSDAVYSVGNYLKAHGWCDSMPQRRLAVFSYNNSYDYVDAVINLAEKVKN